MTTALIHTGISHAKDGRLQQAVTAIKERHRASHSAALKCKCYHEILDLFEARYTTEDDEWFTPLAGVYLADLPQIIEDAKQHKVPPAEIDDTIFRARRAFYTSRLRVLIPQVLEWDPVNRQETFRKVQYGFKTGEEDSVIEYVNQSLGRLGGIKSTSEHLLRELPDKLVLAKSREEQVKIVGEAFFADEKGEVPESLLKYITMLQEGKTLDLVVLDMMTEYHDVWFKARDSWKLKQRLDYLYRAEVAHYADMERKAELDRQAALLESLPDYVWEVPPCVVCGKELRDRRFHTCSICSVFAINELQPLYTRVYCSLECHSVDVVTHRFTHHCSAGTKCLTRHAAPAPSAESSPLSTLSSMSTPSSFSPPPPESSDHRFCIECINVLKRPTVWCTLKCAMKNFVQHRKDVHLPARQKMDTQGVIPADGGFMDKHEVYNQEDIEGLTITIEQGAKQWYDKFLQEVEITDPLLPGDKTFWM
ncbi:hypothetical protein QBC38DRAFT_352842 [Podospora fimiseda]|uniref:Uncharacterized protein n=1 Tax=Podospora fimiseda TaxID=252190 RepID=A0AAN7H8T8_9PEZI|nr:hypothetical protein QBC38DRAFT_352842 [Podospora fimiseda]